MTPRPVYVKWVDSGSSAGWEMLAELDRECIECVTLGFLLDETDESITVAASLGLRNDGTPNQANNPITIPFMAILEWWDVTGVHPKQPTR